MLRLSRTRIGLLSSAASSLGGSFTPLSLFSAGEQGYWLDSSDFSTMFQDTAGATPVTAVGQSVRLMLDKSGQGNHFTQSSTSNAPILGRNPVVGTRNLLTRTEEFANAAWTKTASTVTANTAVAPDGTTTADTLTETAATSGHVVSGSATVTTATHVFSVYLKKGSGATAPNWVQLYTGGVSAQYANFNLGTGTVGSVAAGSTATITNVGNGWYRCTLSFTPSSSGSLTTAIAFTNNTDTTTRGPSYAGATSSDVFIWGAQLEAGSTATAYQRVGSAFDVTEAGVADAYYLAYDGTDDWLQSGTITPGTDKVQVFAGVRKLSDAASAVLLESSVSIGANNGSISLWAPVSATPTYRWFTKGTVEANAAASGFAAPVTNVLTGIGDISGDSAQLRINGAVTGTSSADQGTGNYLAYSHYIGRRAGSTLPFNGRIYQLICRFGPNLTAAQIQQVETFVNQRTGAY